MQSICCSVDAKECNSIAIDTSIERMCEAKGQSEMKCIIGIPIFRMKAERSTLSTADEPMMPEKNEHRTSPCKDISPWSMAKQGPHGPNRTKTTLASSSLTRTRKSEKMFRGSRWLSDHARNMTPRPPVCRMRHTPTTGAYRRFLVFARPHSESELWL